MKILEMTSLKLKDSNGDTKLVFTPSSSKINDLALNDLTYFRKYSKKGDFTIFFGIPIKKCYRQKLKYNKRYFKPKNETTNIILFAERHGVLKINGIL